MSEICYLPHVHFAVYYWEYDLVFYISDAANIIW